MFQYRHSPHWILSGTISALKGHNSLLMHYKAMRWEKFSSHQSHINYDVSIQTLITLNLSGNYIGVEGAQLLAHALQSNAVREILSSSITYQVLCLIQTLTILNLMKNNIGDAGAQHLAHALQSNAVGEVVLTSVTYQLLCFNIDTHHTAS
jgi:Ran GTPase-activating protein (RanGAP) involved in mRNA processing and transport